jgi:hypothetical protein
VGRLFERECVFVCVCVCVCVQGNSEQKKQPHLRQNAVGGLIDTESLINEQQQSVSCTVSQEYNMNSLSSYDMLRTVRLSGALVNC